MKRELLQSCLIACLLTAAPVIAQAQNSTNEPVAGTTMGAGEVDAGKLIGKNVVDAQGKTVGEIDSVLVNEKGKVNAVVLDVSSFLESKKLITVPWTDLKTNADGDITSSLTKDSAKAASDYKYKNADARGNVLTDSGEVYKSKTANSGDAASTSTTDASAGTKTSMKNNDGSLNASQIIGLKVTDAQDKSVGKVSEVLLGENGKIDGVVVDVGGVLGVGAHPVRLGWKELHLTEKDNAATAMVNKTVDQLKAMPKYQTAAD
ncbi:MAG: PRC-barrel domain-containing protein [Dongiaceae bacterium]